MNFTGDDSEYDTDDVLGGFESKLSDDEISQVQEIKLVEVTERCSDKGTCATAVTAYPKAYIKHT